MGETTRDHSDHRPLIELGSELDHFKIVRLLGRGGMGEVYLARDMRLGRRVAIKVVHPDSIGDQTALERFQLEARVTARFNHPHIVTVYAVGAHDGFPYVALEYLPGQTLRERMDEGLLGVRESIRVGVAVADALSEAHRNDILHRDLKPENVIIPKDGRLRVLDFGLARVVSAEADADVQPASAATPAARETASSLPTALNLGLTVEKGLRGTPKYMAPEQWQERPPTAASDVWALGLILYELLAGKHPFEGLPVYGLAVKVGGSGQVPRLTPPPDAPGAVVELVDRCLDKDVEARPSADEAAETLRSLIYGERLRVAQTRSPFRGLLPFSERHSDLFFGRDAEIASFLERYREEPVLPVVGPSGAGKSSFVQAGIIPRVREQGAVRVLRLRPGAQPFLALATRLISTERTVSGGSSRFSRVSGDLSTSATVVDTGAGDEVVVRATPNTGEYRAIEGVEPSRPSDMAANLAARLRETPGLLALVLQDIAEHEGSQVLLFVDQLEEVYTLVEDPETRLRFCQAICTAADDPQGPVRTLFTLRDDYLGRLAESAEAREALSRVTVVRAPGEASLKEILSEPLRAVGYRYEDDDLVEDMVAAVSGEPACLPLLQFACSMLWERRQQETQVLPRKAYAAIGGVAGALAHHADGVLSGFSAGQIQLTRQVLLRLVSAEGTRMVVTRSQLLDGLAPEAEDVLERLSQARLVLARKRTADEGRAETELEIAHESLIERWDRLARWVDEGREELAFAGEVGQAARLWEQRGRREEEVWHGDALHEALRRMDRYASSLPEAVREFITAGQAREVRIRRRKRWRRFILTAGLTAVSVVSVIVALVVMDQKREVSRQKERVERQRSRAQEQRQRARQRFAEAQREGARAALMRGELLEARAKLRGSLETEDSPLARALWWRLTRQPLHWKHGLGALVYAVDFSPDGRWVAAACQDKSVYLFDVQTRRMRVLRGHEDQIFAVAFSPDGKRLAAGTWRGRVWLWDLERHAATVLSGHSAMVMSLAFTPDGKRFASAGDDRTIRIWNTQTGQSVRVLRGHNDRIRSLAFSTDGKQLASASSDRTVRLWDAARGTTQRVLRGHAGMVYAVAYSPDGTRIASGGYDNTIRLWDRHTGAAQQTLRGHEGGVSSVDFDPSGRYLVSGGRDKQVRVWDLKHHRLARQLEGHTGGVNAVRFGPRGRFLVSGSRDKSIRVWRWRVRTPLLGTVGHAAGVYAVAFHPAGSQVASGGLDQRIRLWDVKRGMTQRVLRGHTAGIWDLDYSRDGKRLASAGRDATIRLWSLPTGRLDKVLLGHGGPVFGVAFSPDGKLLASGSFDRTIRLWDVARGAELRKLTGHRFRVWAVAFGPEGKRVASGSNDHTVRLWDVTTGHQLHSLTGHTGAVHGVAFSPDGRQVASASADKTVRLWSTATGKGRVLARLKHRVYRVRFHPDGKRVATTVADGTVRLWALDGNPGPVLRGHVAEVNDVAFSADGKLVATASDDSTVRLWSGVTGRAYWRAPMLRHRPPEMLTHLGWVGLAGQSGYTAGKQAWHRRAAAVARRGVQAPGSPLLCLWTDDDHLEIWDVRRDRRTFRGPVDGADQVLATSAGCVIRSRGRVRWYNRSGAYRDLVQGATAVGRDGERILVADRQRIRVFAEGGTALSSHEGHVGVSAVLRWGDSFVLGHADGNLELQRLGQKRGRAGYSFEGVPSSPVVRLLAGPMGTVIAGFANGVVGLWNRANGTQLYHLRLHGPVVHLNRAGSRLYAATELGAYRGLDLGVFDLEYCELLRRVWGAVRVVWEAGLPTRREPPRGHRCSSR